MLNNIPRYRVATNCLRIQNNIFFKVGLLSIITLFILKSNCVAQIKSNKIATLTIVPSTLKQIGLVDERFQSYNVEMAEVIGGNFWKPYDKNELSNTKVIAPLDNPAIAIDHTNTSLYQAIPPINLYDKRLRILASALGPVYVRVSGTWANTVYFKNNDSDTALPKGFNGALSKNQWKGVVDYIKAVDAKLVTSFSVGDGVRNSEGILVAELAADSFCYSMVRNLVGAAVCVAEGRFGPDWIQATLENKERISDSLVFPSRGLTLRQVDYSE